MIVLGDTYYSSTDTFLTGVLGTSTAPVGHSGGSATQTAAVTGTTFADDPLNIYTASSTHPITIGNAGIDEVFYTGTDGDWVTRSIIGSGDMFYLAWDYCCVSETVSDGWYAVLDSAINYESVSVSEPSILALFGLGLAGIGFARKKKIA